MTATITRINPSNIKECTMPDALQQIESAETAFVITVTKGKWAFKSIKSDRSYYEVIGILRCISLRLEQMLDRDSR